MGNFSFSTQSLIINFFILLPCFLHVLCDTTVNKTNRETLEITIGIGGDGGGSSCGCSPETLIFADVRLAVVYPVIQKFKEIITTDPLGITKSWEGADICNNYTGFFCDNPPDNKSAIGLASIDFNGFQLGAPSLEGFLDQLPDIALFHANTNNFSGTISPKIAKLTYLYELDLSNNKFTGQFPTSVLGLKGLSFFDIRYNFFSGTVPPQVFSQAFDILFINNNNFTQTLPYNLGNTTVRYLTLAGNNFVGTIPRSIGKASATLVEVLLLNNKLSGCLPYEIGFLKKATVFDAGNNKLTGLIPCSFACLEKMEQLNFAGNQLYGQIPEVVCRLQNLANLSLSNNYFTHVGPICRELIQSGVLDVRKNCIPYVAEQRSAVECKAFFAHPRSCPYIASYNYIPCKLPPYPHKPFPRFHTPSRVPSPSYNALIRHRL